MQTNLHDVYFHHADHTVGSTKVDAHYDKPVAGASRSLVDVPYWNLSRTRVWDKVPEESTLVLWKCLDFLIKECRRNREKPLCKNSATSMQPFRYNVGF